MDDFQLNVVRQGFSALGELVGDHLEDVMQLLLSFFWCVADGMAPVDRRDIRDIAAVIVAATNDMVVEERFHLHGTYTCSPCAAKATAVLNSPAARLEQSPPLARLRMRRGAQCFGRDWEVLDLLFCLVDETCRTGSADDAQSERQRQRDDLCRCDGSPAAIRARKYSTFRSVGMWRGSPCHASRGHSMSLTDSMERDVTDLNMSVLLIEKQTPRVTVLTLNRPERRNSLTIELMTELVTAIEAANADEQQRILILKGGGKAFCTGMDLNEVAQPEKAHDSAQLVAKTLITLSETRLITIAAVQGAAVAGGAGLMSACDFVVAAERTKIGYPEVRRGLVPGMIMTFLRRQLRERDLRELLFGGELFEAERAREIGLVNRVVAPNELENETQKIVAAVLQGAPGALSNTKRLLEILWPTSVREDIEQALAFHMQARESTEAKEGVAAYLEKRKPRWAE